MAQDTPIVTDDQLQSLRITPQTEVKKREFLFQWKGQPCFPRGELVAVTGKAKSGKTYLCSMLMALATKQSVLEFARSNTAFLRVLWIDTEQSEDSTQEILTERVGGLINAPIDNERYYAYNLRSINWQERAQKVELAICSHQPDLIILDGIRDLVGDINDYQRAQEVLERLLSIASWSNACMVCVLHQNKAMEDKTLRGALGTELQNKSFETYECSKDTETRIFTIRQTATRKYDIPGKMAFSVSNLGLPQWCAAPEEGLYKAPEQTLFSDGCQLQKRYSYYGHPLRH